MNNKTMAEVKQIWRVADAVSFDVDSTVIKEEGIDQLANFIGVGERVAQLTKEAMGGQMTFKEALKSRLNIIRPSKQQIEEFVVKRPPTLTPGIRELVRRLHDLDVDVYLVSGGFHNLIHPIAEILNIPVENIYANDIIFNQNGEYSNFDENQLTCDSGGKPKVMKELKTKYGYKQLVHIGDGATDSEACPPADAFIGFGGNVVRESVRKNCSWFVTDFKELIDSLESSQ